MNQGRTKHLSGEEINIALVDRTELSPEAQEHLDNCPECRAQVGLISERLNNLGRLVREYSPLTRNRFAVPSKRMGFGFLFSRPLALAGSGALALAFLAFLGLNIWGTGGGMDPAMVAPTDQVKLSSVEAELAGAETLSPFHSFVMGRSTAVVNDEFLKFVSEPLENI